ncbi:uncharacterized protein EDB93DRAFT_1324701 [Suillus bovinus]|uniref:uncharacterized protein n=1 Tax=Suillus bovinus TaxID=48563 RepID=UPI001B87E701|nr:uncharacterized protein EDB93DRAFT_1324701 [Suillus bovinus]KAG2159242.1 hypothetical protein EDB93DRAFT_1324701 [Suillus bovinus]
MICGSVKSSVLPILLSEMKASPPVFTYYQPVKHEPQSAGRLESQPQATQVTQQPKSAPDPTHNQLVRAPELVATGMFMNPDTTRIIAKRVILTGHPFKVHKKTATVRYMFFYPVFQAYSAVHETWADGTYPGWTHGYFKTHFDGPINQMDTVCMSLYKRVYPRWSENWATFGASSGKGDEMEDIMLKDIEKNN